MNKTKKNNYLLHIGLFILTFLTTTIAGAEWISGTPGPYEISFLAKGLPYSLSMLFILSCHEFGHYFAAKIHKVDATLPFFIPFPSIAGFLNFGTMGAVIKTRSPIETRKAMFDIGVAGPIAGFIACLIILFWGFTHIPGKEYILSIHPDYFSQDFGKGQLELAFGNTFLFSFFKNIFVDTSIFFPPMSEIYHYPYLCVGWFGLFVTAMNMIPVGQLDGGHISYTMYGKETHFKVAVISFAILFILGTLGILEGVFDFGVTFGWSGWLFWALVLYFFIKLKHPPVPDNTALDFKRKLLGYISFIILLLSFSPTPFIISFGG
ncbi:MAG: site-2 protease family protein [Ignavibacteriales bacterium CG_4_9_14_3_um_filter_30_11]|nr:MAG: site-2 protease family protein [Ignavibacteriales bacterium CG_4_9_14_3_um_filter_30_11]